MADPLFRQAAGRQVVVPVGPPPSPAPLAVGLCLAAGTLLLYTASLSVYFDLDLGMMSETKLLVHYNFKSQQYTVPNI